MLQDMLSFLCQRLFGRTQCKPSETQLLEEKETEATGNCRELQAGHPETTAQPSDSKEISSDVTPKTTTVLIMVAPPDFQQVG